MIKMLKEKEEFGMRRRTRRRNKGGKYNNHIATDLTRTVSSPGRVDPNSDEF